MRRPVRVQQTAAAAWKSSDRWRGSSECCGRRVWTSGAKCRTASVRVIAQATSLAPMIIRPPKRRVLAGSSGMSIAREPRAAVLGRHERVAPLLRTWAAAKWPRAPWEQRTAWHAWPAAAWCSTSASRVAAEGNCQCLPSKGPAEHGKGVKGRPAEAGGNRRRPAEAGARAGRFRTPATCYGRVSA